MTKSSANKTKSNKDLYWSGVFTGVFLGCFFICIVLTVFIKAQGLQIAVNPEQLAGMVQAKVRNEAKHDIPQILEDLKKTLPNELPNHLEELDELTIGFGNSRVKLPPEVTATIKMEFSRIFETAILNTLNNYNTKRYEELTGKNAYRMVESVLRQEIIGRTYLVKSSKWFSIPVKVVASTENKIQIGI